MTLVIGLTGSIATGKSTIANMFKELSIEVIDADQLARDIVEPGEAVYNLLVTRFGEKILREDKTLNREKLGSIIFADENKRKQLNEIMHPAIRQRMIDRRDEAIKRNDQCVVLDIPLLFENQLTDYVEKIVVVYVDEQTQLNRLMNRNGFTKDEALERVKSQISIVDKVELADGVIDNRGTIEQSFAQLKNILLKWNIKLPF